jgi:mRNA interferase HicA
MTYREVERKLRQLGCREISRRSGGSHRKWMNPATGQATTVPDWGAKDLKLGTIRGIVRQLGMDWQAFEDA